MFIKELHILTDNPEESSAFYANGLGLPVLHETDNNITLSLKHSTLTFHHSEVKNPKYHFAINIPRNKINEALNWVSHIIHPVIIENGSAVADFRNWHAEAFYFFDNNGNILELIARRDLKNEAYQPFGSDQLLSISEIGIVTKDVLSECNTLIEKYDIHYFDKQPPLKNFAALGDDNGLLIVVPEGRHWYPTNIPSSIHWLKAIVQTGNGVFAIERKGVAG